MGSTKVQAESPSMEQRINRVKDGDMDKIPPLKCEMHSVHLWKDKPSSEGWA